MPSHIIIGTVNNDLTIKHGKYGKCGKYVCKNIFNHIYIYISIHIYIIHTYIHMILSKMLGTVVI